MINRKTKLILSLALLVPVLVFVIQNTALVGISILFWTLSMSGALLFFLFFMAGAICGALGLSYIHHQDKRLDQSSS